MSIKADARFPSSLLFFFSFFSPRTKRTTTPRNEYNPRRAACVRTDNIVARVVHYLRVQRLVYRVKTKTEIKAETNKGEIAAVAGKVGGEWKKIVKNSSYLVYLTKNGEKKKPSCAFFSLFSHLPPPLPFPLRVANVRRFERATRKKRV